MNPSHGQKRGDYMIITLEEAQVISPDITQDELDGFEVMVRNLTNNNFVSKFVRFKGFTVTDGNKVSLDKPIFGIAAGDTIEIADSLANDGVYYVTAVDGQTLTIDKTLYVGRSETASVFKVDYPADIKAGVKKLLKYDTETAGKTGIKSESIGRMSVTYYDNTKAENIEGYPAAYLSFLDKYKKLRW